MPAILRACLLFSAGASLLSLAPSRAAVAQQVAVTAGQRVRVEWSEGQRRHRAAGTVLGLRTDSLALTAPAGMRTFAISRLDRIDVRVSRSRPWGAARGAALGTLAGLAAGLALGAASYSQCQPGNDMCGLALIGGPLLGGAAGLALGTVIGAASPGQRWQRLR